MFNPVFGNKQGLFGSGGSRGGSTPQARWDRPLPQDNNISGEPVEVTVVFKPEKLLPLAFSLHGNDHRVKKIEFAWKEKRGQEVFYLFSVTDTDERLYKLCFNRQSMHWKLISEDG